MIRDGKRLCRHHYLNPIARRGAFPGLPRRGHLTRPGAEGQESATTMRGRVSLASPEGSPAGKASAPRGGAPSRAPKWIPSDSADSPWHLTPSPGSPAREALRVHDDSCLAPEIHPGNRPSIPKTPLRAPEFPSVFPTPTTRKGPPQRAFPVPTTNQLSTKLRIKRLATSDGSHNCFGTALITAFRAVRTWPSASVVCQDLS
jgi:hypothetical protein